jgi:alanyl-tRNA synthetase
MENNTPILNAHNKDEHQPSHTCEHVVNRTMVNLFGCGRAVSAHIERKKSKLDFALPVCPTDEQIALIETTVNEVLRRNLPVTMEYISQDEAMGRFDMNRLPEGASDTVRVVHVGDYDECLCIGAHVENTSEIGTFKIISHDYKEGIFRMRFKIIQE